MKAEKVLERYQAGERNFQRVNLRGQSFKDKDLSGADFSEADIRGANFTNATLKGANFSCAEAGLQKRWVIVLLIFSFLLSTLSGFISSFAGSCIGFFFLPKAIEKFTLLPGVVFVVVFAVFFIVTIRQGLGAGAVAVAVAVAVPGAIAVAVAVPRAIAIAVPGTVARAVAVPGSFAGIAIIAGAIAVAGAVAGAVAVAVAGVVAVARAGAAAGAVAVARAVATPVTRAGALARAVAVARAVDVPGFIAVAGAVAGAVALLSAYIGWRALAGDKKQAFIKNIAIAFVATGGTSFRGADLTDANFTKATLKNTNFREANLTRTHFYETKQLHLARVDNSILTTPAVLRLLVSGNGRGKSYADADLRGANLIGADLKEANLKNANISEATFQGACLEGANLTLTQAVGTNFTSAQMTGACVEAWNIEHTTILDNVDCRFIYLLEHPKPKTDDRERRPSSDEFKSGEFTKLFQEVFDTVDLIFRNGIDWKAFVAAFKKVQVENEDIELVTQSIENKGDGVVVVKVNVPPGTNKEKIHSDFTQAYELAFKEVEKRYKADLKAKDEQIIIYRQQYTDMKEIVSVLANKPVNVEVNNRAESKAMNESADQSRKIEIGSVGRDFNASGQALNLGEIDISGTVTNTIGQLQESDVPEASQLADLLKQLQAAIEKDENLSKEDKNTALEQVKVLAEVGQKPKEGGMQKAAKTAITMLKGTITGLPATATLAEACSKLLPLITKLFGLG